MYSIIRKANKGGNLGIGYLVLVDRSQTKERWWTSDGDLPILRYKKKSAAEYACKRLKYGKCKVITSNHADDILDRQRKEIIHQEAISTSFDDLGWQGHKLYFKLT